MMTTTTTSMVNRLDVMPERNYAEKRVEKGARRALQWFWFWDRAAVVQRLL